MLAGVLDFGIDLDVWPWVWIGIALLFALIELVLIPGTFIVLPWAGSAFITAILAFYDVNIEIQWAIFVFGGAAMFVVLYLWAKRFVDDHPMEPGVGAERLIGLSALVTAPISPDDTNRAGRIKVEGEVWGALPDGHYRIAEGTRVRITAMHGTRVVVTPEAPESKTDIPAPGGKES